MSITAAVACIADSAEVVAGKLNITGIFDTIPGSSVPIAAPYVLVVQVRWVDESPMGTTEVRLALLDPLGAETGISYGHSYKINTRLSPGSASLDVIQPATNENGDLFGFMGTGVFTWVASVNGQELARIPINVVQVGPSGRPA